MTTDGIAACMRLNAKLTKRIELLRKALEEVAGSPPCEGAILIDGCGVPLPLSVRVKKSIVENHIRHCDRCLARQALDLDAAAGRDAS